MVPINYIITGARERELKSNSKAFFTRGVYVETSVESTYVLYVYHKHDDCCSIKHLTIDYEMVRSYRMCNSNLANRYRLHYIFMGTL